MRFLHIFGKTLTVLLLLGFLSCGTSRRLSGVCLADAVWTFSQTHPDGFTLDIRTLTEPAKGISVAYAATQNSHGREALDAVISHATAHEGFVGGWFNGADSLYYFDSVRLFPEDSLESAVNFGKANSQKAIYRLSSGEEILLEEDPARNPAFQYVGGQEAAGCLPSIVRGSKFPYWGLSSHPAIWEMASSNCAPKVECSFR